MENSNEHDNVIQGPWRPKEDLLDGNDKVIQGPWRSKENLLEEKVSEEQKELSRIRGRKDLANKAYTSYRNRICGATVLIGEGTLMMINDLTDMSPISYVLMIPAMLALGRYLTKEQRQRWKEQMAYLSREEN